MNILVLGGTRLVGRGFVERALARGHRVTLFNRGRTWPERFPEVERLVGDRDGDLSALRGRTWDAVLDPSASQPHRVERSLELLRDKVGFYAYVSSVSVYAGPEVGDEGAPLARWDGSSEGVTPDNYGGYKARCEELVATALADRHALLRLGLVVGPYDDTRRFSALVRRVGRGGEILVPGPPEAPLQVIDGRDVGAFALDVVERGLLGPLNVCGPSIPMEAGLEQIRQGVGSPALQVRWAAPDWLRARGLKAGEEFALWTDEADQWLWRVGRARALSLGLRCRPLAESARDALAWERALVEPTPEPLTLERERAMLGELGG